MKFSLIVDKRRLAGTQWVRWVECGRVAPAMGIERRINEDSDDLEIWTVEASTESSAREIAQAVVDDVLCGVHPCPVALQCCISESDATSV